MNAADAFIAELRTAPDEVVEETRDFFFFVKSRRERQGTSKAKGGQVQLPDFEARLKSIFGETPLPDSAPLINAMREDRI